MSSVQNFIWRHICVRVSDLTYKVLSTAPNLIKIPNKSHIQGAYPLEFSTMLLQGIQCGFLCNHIIVTQPSKGTLQYTGSGWWYFPNDGITETDSFQYKLNIMGQDSEIKTITLLIDGYVP